jgi:hypothetical protein
MFILGDRHVIFGDCIDPDVVARLLGDAKPLPLVTDPVWSRNPNYPSPE